MQIRIVHRISLILMCLCPVFMQAQDVPISQWLNNVMYQSPSWAGFTGKLRANAFYRNQWPMSNAELSYGVFFVDAPLTSKVGCSVGVVDEKNSLYNNIDISTAGSYLLAITRSVHISFGIKLGLSQTSLSVGELEFENPETVGQSTSPLRFDSGLGTSVVFNNWYAVLVADHLNRPYIGISEIESNRVNAKLTFGLSRIFYCETGFRKPQVSIIPNIFYQQQGIQQNLQLGIITQYRVIEIGFWGRKGFNNGQTNAIIGLGYNGLHSRLMYSYDANLCKKIKGNGGAHELSLTWLFDIEKEKKKKMIECPSFLH